MKIAGVRYIGFAGIALFAVSCFMNTGMSRDYSGEYRW
jgi:MFS transporter, DHA2 family, multidrug resistance protein